MARQPSIKLIQTTAHLIRLAREGKTIHATSYLCAYGMNAPVQKAIDCLLSEGVIVEVSKCTLGQPVYKGAKA